MNYCENCNLTVEAARCPLCGSRRLREPRPDDLCFLVRRDQMLSEITKQVLADNQVPYIIRNDLGAGMAMILGSYLEKDCFFVPYEHLPQARELMDALDSAEALEQEDKEETEKESEEDEDDPLPGFPAYAREMVDTALEMGAASCVPFTLKDICFDSRVLLKCMFGCTDWGKGLTCPSRDHSPSMTEYREMFSRYRWGVIIGGHDKHITQKVSFALEDQAFKKGYYFAFSLSDCGLCSTCAGHTGGECRHVRQARPAFHSVGIDVFKTVRQLGLPINTLSDPEHQEQNWYAAVFVE